MTTRKAGAAPKSQPLKDALLDDPAVVLVSSDLRELTVGQIEEIEERIEGPLSAFFDPKARLGKVHRAIAYVLRKADKPEFTYEQSADLKLCIRVEAPVPPIGGSGS